MVRDGLHNQELTVMRLVSTCFKVMLDDVPQLAGIYFTSLQDQRHGYADQEKIEEQRVEKLSAAAHC